MQLGALRGLFCYRVLHGSHCNSVATGKHLLGTLTPSYVCNQESQQANLPKDSYRARSVMLPVVSELLQDLCVDSFMQTLPDIIASELAVQCRYYFIKFTINAT